MPRVNTYDCDGCGRPNTSRQSRYAHKKVCTGIKSIPQQLRDVQEQLKKLMANWTANVDHAAMVMGILNIKVFAFEFEQEIVHIIEYATKKRVFSSKHDLWNVWFVFWLVCIVQLSILFFEVKVVNMTTFIKNHNIHIVLNVT